MRKFILAIVALTVCTGAWGQAFQKGDMVVDLGIGVGCADVYNLDYNTNLMSEGSSATFTQKLSFEYGVAQFGKASIGIGATLANAYGGEFDTMLNGSYNYSYTITTWHYNSSNYRRKWEQKRHQSNRKGSGFVKTTGHIDDVNLLLKGSFHYEFVERLDTYVTLGLGVSVLNTLYSYDEKDADGFSSDRKTFDKRDTDDTYQLEYYYNDLDHVKWEDKAEAKARFAMALNLGARYFVTDNWGINAELGLTSASFKKHANVYGIFSVGASYKF